MSRLFYTRETQLQRDCIEYLKLRKIFHYRQNSGALKTEKGFYRFTSISGLPDVIAIIQGKYVGFEFKLKGNYLSKKQKETKELIERAGGYYFVIRSLDELIDVIRRFNG